MRLIIGNKNYSSWSLRAWLALKQFDIPFEEERIALFERGYKARILHHSPAGKVPVLIDDDVRVWESLAIGEYLADRFPQHQIWPKDQAARALARAVSAEMHAGFGELRAAMPMNIWSSHPGKGRSPLVDADIERVAAIWRDCIARYGGPCLFGKFTFADAMFAPVATRFITYAVDLDLRPRQYVRHIWELPAMLEWREAACAETEVIEEDEPYR